MERRSDPFVNDGRLEYIDVGLAELPVCTVDEQHFLPLPCSSFFEKGVEGVEYLIIFAVVIGMHRRKEVVFFLA